GRAHKALGQYDKAIAIYSRAIELDPYYLEGEGWIERAACYEGLKQWDNAIADWSKAIELAPKHARAGLRMSRALGRARGGQVDAAILEAEDVAKNANANMLYNAACVLALAA